MLKLFKRTKAGAVHLCDRCSSVLVAADRREAILARNREWVLLRYGWRLV